MDKSSSGFTLVELLVVVTIISLLTAIGVVNYISLIESSRDSKRQSDMKVIQSALQQYHADQRYYPLPSSSCGNGTFSIGCSLKSPDGSKVYLKEVPRDPVQRISQPNYIYEALPKVGQGGSKDCDNTLTSLVDNRCKDYCLYTKVERSGNAVAIPSGSDCRFPSEGYNYFVSSP